MLSMKHQWVKTYTGWFRRFELLNLDSQKRWEIIDL